jgi:hypothetical protein
MPTVLTLFFPLGSPGFFTSTNHLFHDVTFNDYGYIETYVSTFHNVMYAGAGSVAGDSSTFHKIIFFDDASFSSNNFFDTLFFNNPGHVIILNANSVLTINDALLENALPGFPILLHSSSTGTQATISKSSGTVCLNYF